MLSSVAAYCRRDAAVTATWIATHSKARVPATVRVAASQPWSERVM
jgi:hypothetical protein